MPRTFAGSTQPMGLRPLPTGRVKVGRARQRPDVVIPQPKPIPPKPKLPIPPVPPRPVPKDDWKTWWNQFLLSPEQRYLRQGIYSTYAGGLGGPSNYQGWLNSLYPELESRFYGSIMPQIEKGQMPNVNFQDWLKTLNLNQEFLGLNPYARGERPGSFVTPGRFLWR